MLNYFAYLVIYFSVVFFTQDGEQQSASITPEKMGFTPRKLQNMHGDVNYYLATGGKPLDTSRKLPLVVYLDGSGSSPIYWGDKNQMGCSLMFDSRDIPGFHYVAISKPGINFHAKTRIVSSKEFDEKLSLRWRVDAVNSVIDQLANEEFIDLSRVLVIGHSEGADVAPWVALENKHVTHVAGLAPGGVSQMFDFILFVRRQVATGKISQAEGDEQIRDIKKAYREIFDDPKSTTRKWQGLTHLRWSSFFRPGMEAWCKLEKPVYLGICRDDQNTPVEAGEAIEIEFIRLGKKNLTSKVWPCDHYFVESVDGEDDSTIVDRRLDVLKTVLEWSEKTN